MRTLIIDDEITARRTLRNYIARYAPRLELIGEADSVESGITEIRKLQPELVFLDVRMQDGTGFDLLQMLPKVDFQVIFATAFDAFAIDAFRARAVDYLLKPIDPRQFMEAVERLRQPKVETPNYQVHGQMRTPEGLAAEKLVLSTQESIHVVGISDIVRCEADGSYTTVFVADGSMILVSRALRQLEERLADHDFFRVHQSHLINLHYLSKFEKQMMRAHLGTGHVVPVATRRKTLLLEWLEQHS